MHGEAVDGIPSHVCLLAARTLVYPPVSVGENVCRAPANVCKLPSWETSSNCLQKRSNLDIWIPCFITYPCSWSSFYLNRVLPHKDTTNKGSYLLGFEQKPSGADLPAILWLFLRRVSESGVQGPLSSEFHRSC